MQATTTTTPTTEGIEHNSELRIKASELITFTEQLRNSVESGTPLLQGLTKIQETASNRDFADALNLIIIDLTNGKSLSDSLERYPMIFTDEYRALIFAGESSANWTSKIEPNGNVREGIFDLLISYLEKRDKTRRKVVEAVIYPLFIAGVILVAIGLFTFVIMPSLKDLIFQLTPPEKQWALTKAMFAICDVIRDYWFLAPIIIIATFVMLFAYWQTGNGKQVWMQYQLSVPGLKEIFTRLNQAEVLWLMGTLLSAGLSAQETLDVLIRTIRNRFVAKHLELTKEFIYQGFNLCDGLKKSHWLFDGEFYMVVFNAEDTGRLATLQTYAKRQFEKVEQLIDNAVRFIEPVLICIAGGVIGLIAVTFYSSISNALTGMVNIK